MNALDLIQFKQRCWAKRRGLELVSGTIGKDGEKNYVNDLDQNLFEPLSEESIACYAQGDGNETQDGGKRLAKMKALHSSSAIVVNVFQYWQKRNVSPLLAACKLPTTRVVTKECKDIGSGADSAIVETSKPLHFDSIKFEEKFEISPNKGMFPFAPNIDIVIKGDYEFAFESKFTEPYSSRHDGLKDKYVEEDSFWEGLGNLYELAKEISPYNNKFRYLDAAQLIKHILGLKKKYSASHDDGQPAKPQDFYLIYLWYDVLGEEGFRHREEIEQFARIVGKDDIRFKHITYQDLITNLVKECYEGNEAYCDYLTDRYL